MGSVFVRKGYKNLYIKFKKLDGTWSPPKNTGVPKDEPGAEEKARKILKKVQASIGAISDSDADATGPLTVSRYADLWIEKRRRLGIADATNEESRLRIHVLPHLGHLLLDDVRPRHLAKLVQDIRANSKIASKTRHNIYSSIAALYRDAEIDGLVERTPCILTKHQLGEARDKDPNFRDQAIFQSGEFLTLLTDLRIPFERRIRYALAGLGCLRIGEIAGLRWRFLDESKPPLAAIKIRFTYQKPCPQNKRARDMPVHKLLAEMLSEWRSHGWAETFGRPPTPDDFVLPYWKKRPGRRGRHGGSTGEMKMLTKNAMWKGLQADLLLVGFRPRRAYDLRRTGISLYRNAGAIRDVLAWATHGRSKEMTIDDYTNMDWQTLCAEIAKLKIVRPAASGAGSGSAGGGAESHRNESLPQESTEETALPGAMADQLDLDLPLDLLLATCQNHKRKRVEAPGVEPRKS